MFCFLFVFLFFNHFCWYALHSATFFSNYLFDFTTIIYIYMKNQNEKLGNFKLKPFLSEKKPKKTFTYYIKMIVLKFVIFGVEQLLFIPSLTVSLFLYHLCNNGMVWWRKLLYWITLINHVPKFQIAASCYLLWYKN